MRGAVGVEALLPRVLRLLAVRACVEAVSNRSGRIDVLINNAGVLGDMKAQSSGALDYAEFEEVMAVNVFGALAMADAFRDHVAASSQKKIVSITSRSGIISQPGYRGPSFYRASKVALNMVMRVFADEVRDRHGQHAQDRPPAVAPQGAVGTAEAQTREGIAETGPELVAGDGQELAAEVLGRLGFEYDAEVGSRVVEAWNLLAPVSANVAMLLHDRGASPEEAREYAAAWSLLPDERVDTMIDSQVRSPSPAYAHTYWQGYELVSAYVGGDAGRFRQLLTSRLLAADLSA